MVGAVAAAFARKMLALIADQPLQGREVLVVDLVDLLAAEAALGDLADAQPFLLLLLDNSGWRAQLPLTNCPAAINNLHCTSLDIWLTEEIDPG